MSAGVNDWCRNQRMRQEQEIEKLRVENRQLSNQLIELTKRVQSAGAIAKAVNLPHSAARCAVHNALTGQNMSLDDFMRRFFKEGLWV